MRIHTVLVTVVILCAVSAIALFSYAYWKGHQYKYATDVFGQKADAIASSTIADGQYVATIRSTTTYADITTITFSHVTYFEGTEASTTAAAEGNCGDTLLEACAPTLSRGFYVRPSGADDFSAPIAETVNIVLDDKSQATLKDFEEMQRVSNPVFDVRISDGKVVQLTEKSPL